MKPISFQIDFRVPVVLTLSCPDSKEAELGSLSPKVNSLASADSKNVDVASMENLSCTDVLILHEGSGPENTASFIMEPFQLESGDVPLQVSGPTYPGRANGKNNIVSEVGVGTLSYVYKNSIYSRSGSTQSSVAGSPPRLLPSTPMIVSLTGRLSAPGAARLKLPPGISDTIINVYDDEPTSIIAYALLTPDYQASGHVKVRSV